MTMRLSSRLSGTSSATMRWAKPSTIAVLPTPGSPIRTGLFLVRRFKIVIIVEFDFPDRRLDQVYLRALGVKSVPKKSNVF